MQVYVCHAEADDSCAEAVGGGLVGQGYDVWQVPAGITPEMVRYRHALEDGVRGSGALVLIWSQAAAESAWVERQLRFAARFQRPVCIVLQDETPLPNTVIPAGVVPWASAGDDVAVALRPYLPAPEGDPDLARVLAQLTHAYIRERQAGIEMAEALLKEEAHQTELLLQLEYLAEQDGIGLVRKAAAAALERYHGTVPERQQAEDERRHIFAVRCPLGHVSYYDRREVCGPNGVFPREVALGPDDLDVIVLPCKHPGCPHDKLRVKVDCEGYK